MPWGLPFCHVFVVQMPEQMSCWEPYWPWAVVPSFGCPWNGDQLILGNTQGSHVHGQSIGRLEGARQTK